jgi:dienelactone hydrolase
MAEVLLFHHAQGVTPGIGAFADELRAAGHTVHVPDLFDGRTFGSIDDGMAFINAQGFDALRERGVRTADDLPAELVYGGFSFGETIAQQLAQTRSGARGALLFYSCVPITGEWAFGPWPDAYFVGEGDIDAAREIVATVPDSELFLYPGDQHYFADSSLPSYDPEAAALLMTRVLEFLARV